VAPANGHAGVAGDCGQTFRQRRDPGPGSIVAAGEDHCRGGSDRSSPAELLLEPVVPYAQQHQVDTPAERLERRDAWTAVDLLIRRVHGQDLPIEPADPELAQHLPPERTLAAAGADHGDGPD